MTHPVPEPPAPDLLERARRSAQAGARGDYELAASFYAVDGVWDMSPMGLGVSEGIDAIREFWREWVGAYEDLAIVTEEISDLGGGVNYAIFSQTGRPVGSSGVVAITYGSMSVWRAGLMLRTVNYGDTDQGRTDAERLAASRARVA